MRFAFLANFTGVPAISFPAAYKTVGDCSIPLAVQVIGKWWDEHTLLKVAHVVEMKVKKLAPKTLYKVL